MREGNLLNHNGIYWPDKTKTPACDGLAFHNPRFAAPRAICYIFCLVPRAHGRKQSEPGERRIDSHLPQSLMSGSEKIPLYIYQNVKEFREKLR